MEILFTAPSDQTAKKYFGISLVFKYKNLKIAKSRYIYCTWDV